MHGGGGRGEPKMKKMLEINLRIKNVVIVGKGMGLRD